MKSRCIPMMAAVVLLLASCQTPTPHQREGQDYTSENPDFAAAGIIDVAVLRPEVPSVNDNQVLQGILRSAARRYLIDAKRYSVPSDAFVDTIVNTLPSADRPEQVISAADSDAALLISIDQWETGDLLPKGRVYAGGRATMYGADGVLWERTFRDWTRLAPANVTASNRAAIQDQMLTNVITEVLSTIPPKPTR